MTRPTMAGNQLQLILLFVTLLSGFSASSARAQTDSADIPSVSTATAIKGVRVVQAPGRVIENGTVFFRNGVIEAVGELVDIPYDARIIDGSGLIVYAGFIDALSRVGVPELKEEAEPESVPDRSNPTFERAGITPEKDVRTLLDPTDKSVQAHRNLGFTTVQSVPYGRMLPGSSAIVLLTGDDAAAMVLRGEEAMFFQFSGARGVYPGTPMGILAKFRQLYHEAERRIRLESLYADDPGGMARPPYDPVHSAFFDVIKSDKPVFAFTGDALEVHRALNLREEFALNLTVAGLAGGWDTLERISETGVGVALTLAIPEKPKWAADIKADSLDQILASYTEATRTATFRDVEAERRNLEARQLQSRSQFVETPRMYAEANIPFAFTSYGVKATDIESNLKEFVEAGLSSEDALAALTTNPAALLGLSSIMGSIDVGKMANLVVTSGKLFADSTKVKFVFVDGQMYEIESDTKKDDKDSPDRDER